MLFEIGNHCSNILEAWFRGVPSILDTGRACWDADNALGPSKKKLLLKELPFSKSTFSKYVGIGATEWLHDAKVQNVLPPKFSVIYLLSNLKKDEFDLLADEGLLTPRLKRTDLERWIKNRSAAPSPPKGEVRLPSQFYAAFQPTRQLANCEHENFSALAEALGDKFGMRLVYPRDKPNLEWDRAVAYVRAEVKKIVRLELEKRFKKYGGATFKKKPTLRKYAGLYSDEVEIAADADLDRLTEVLSVFGREEEIHSLWQLACETFDTDSPILTPQWMKHLDDKPPPKSALMEDLAEAAEHLRQFGRDMTFDKLREKSRDFK